MVSISYLLNVARVRLGQTLSTARLLPPAGPSVLIVPLERKRKYTSSGSMLYRGRVA